MENKKCKKCNIELNEENKIKRENICRLCKKNRDNEYRAKKKSNLETQSINEPPIIEACVTNDNNEILKCRNCKCNLTNINKIPKELICKSCQKIKHS